MRTRSTDLTSSIAWSGWCPRARSSCSAVPTPPKTMSAPSARQAVITNSNCAGQNARLQRPAREQHRRQRGATRRQDQPRPAPALGAGGQRRGGDMEEGMRILAARRRDPDVLRPAEPEDQRRDPHQDPGNAEGHRGPVLPKKNRHQQRREKAAEVDRPVERVEDDLGESLAGLVELVADERHHERLDSAGSERDQEQAGVEAAPVVVEGGQQRVAGAVDQREPEHGVVLAEEPIRQPPAQQREEVHADDEAVEDVLGQPRALRRGGVQQQRRHQERCQDVAHPVEAEALAGLVADDVGDLPRQPHGGTGGGSGHGQDVAAVGRRIADRAARPRHPPLAPSR